MISSGLIGAGLNGRQALNQVRVRVYPFTSPPRPRQQYAAAKLVSHNYSTLPVPVPLRSSLLTFVLIRRTLSTSSFRPTASPSRPSTSQELATTSNEDKDKDLQHKDLIIYEQGTPDYFKKLSFLSVLQLVFFAATAFALGGLRDTSAASAPTNRPTSGAEERFEKLSIPDKSDDEEELPFWRRVNLGDPKLKNSLQTGVCVLGYLFLGLTWLFIYRSVHYIVLRKDPRAATIVTYAPFGRHRYVDVLINEVSAEGSRQNRLFPNMKLRVKGHAITYKIDLRNGRFRKPELFDSTVGRRRNLD